MQHAGVIHQIPRREIVRAITHQVVTGNQLQGVFPIQHLLMQHHLTVGIELLQPVRGGAPLRLAEPVHAMDHLPLQVR